MEGPRLMKIIKNSQSSLKISNVTSSTWLPCSYESAETKAKKDEDGSSWAEKWCTSFASVEARVEACEDERTVNDDDDLRGRAESLVVSLEVEVLGWCFAIREVSKAFVFMRAGGSPGFSFEKLKIRGIPGISRHRDMNLLAKQYFLWNMPTTSSQTIRVTMRISGPNQTSNDEYSHITITIQKTKSKEK